MLSLKISNALIVDGSGEEAYPADVGIEGEKITEIGDLSAMETEKTIDGTGKVLAPGLIDFHTHSDLSDYYDHRMRNRIYNGVTTEVVANCGVGVAPVSDAHREELRDYLKTRIIGNIPVELELSWNSFQEYIDALNSVHPACNIAPLLAQGAVHIAEMGLSQEEPDEEAVGRMKASVKEAFDAGAVGMSSGLIYLPGIFTSKKEMAELAGVMKDYEGAFYVSHIRNEGDTRYESVKEGLDVAKAAGVPFHISHFKITGAKNAGRTAEYFQFLQELEEESGVRITWDAYPYHKGMTSLMSILPAWVSEGGIQNLVERLRDPMIRERLRENIQEGIAGWQNNTVKDLDFDFDRFTIASAKLEKNVWMEGKTIGTLAELAGSDPLEFIFDLLVEEQARTLMVLEGARESDVEEIICNPKTVIGSDSMSCGTDGLLSGGKPHPRTFGTHAKVLAYYCRTLGRLSLPLAIQKMTSMPAALLGLNKRGLIKTGYYADLILFDFERVKDLATYENPKQYSEGMELVLVNGGVALEQGTATKTCSGRVVLRNRD